MVRKITIDGGLLRENASDPSIKILVAWEAEGKIEIHESDRAKVAAEPAPAWTPGGGPKKRSGYRAVAKTAPGGVSFQRLSAVLFPQRDASRLNMTQINDVAHLLRHHVLGHSIFVTNNSHDFIDLGRRERLKAAFQIIVLTPDEAVAEIKKAG